MARLAYVFAAVVLSHMQLDLFLVFGPFLKSRLDDDVAQLYRRFEPHQTL
jgi:hypothetical protein